MIPTFNELGQLTNIKITSSGQAFKQIPNIYIESETGYNAKIVPRFCVDRVGEDDYKDPTIQDKIVNVVDCVIMPVVMLITNHTMVHMMYRK